MLTPEENDAMEGKLKGILANADLSWFTYPVLGDSLRRYVVAFTDNQVWSVELLVAQAVLDAWRFWQVTIGWRISPEERIVIDIGTSTDDLAQAIRLGKAYDQKAIREREEKQEIRLG